MDSTEALHPGSKWVSAVHLPGFGGLGGEGRTPVSLPYAAVTAAVEGAAGCVSHPNVPLTRGDTTPEPPVDKAIPPRLRPKGGVVTTEARVRKVLLVCSLGLAVGVAYFGVTRAITGATAAPDLPDELPASRLPVVALSDSVRAELASRFAGAAAEKYGITSESYDNVRVLARTARGAVYVVPGSHGVCLSLADAAGCASLPATEPLVAALLVPDPASGHYVGAGLLRDEVRSVVVTRADGTTTLARPILGGFEIGPDHRAGRRLELDARTQ